MEGKSSELPIEYKSEQPIEKKQIDRKLLEFIYYKVFPEESSILEKSDFQIEFYCLGENKSSLKVNILSEASKNIVRTLRGDLSKEFVNLVKDKKFDKTNIFQASPCDQSLA